MKVSAQGHFLSTMSQNRRLALILSLVIVSIGVYLGAMYMPLESWSRTPKTQQTTMATTSLEPPYEAPLESTTGNDASIIPNAYIVELRRGYNFIEHAKTIDKNLSPHLEELRTEKYDFNEKEEWVFREGVVYYVKDIDDELLVVIRADRGVWKVYYQDNQI